MRHHDGTDNLVVMLGDSDLMRPEAYGPSLLGMITRDSSVEVEGPFQVVSESGSQPVVDPATASVSS